MFEPNYVTFFIVIICDILRRNNRYNFYKKACFFVVGLLLIKNIAISVPTYLWK